MTPDVLIIGAGIVGAACARRLAMLGIQVSLVDAHQSAAGATTAGMGHLVVMDDSPAQFALTRYGCQLWQQLMPQLPSWVEYDRCGTLWVAADEEELRAAQSKCTAYREQGVRAIMLGADSLAESEPCLRPA